MDFTLPRETQEFAAELRRWADGRPVFETDRTTDEEGWKQLAGFGLLTLEADGGTPLDTAVGVMAASRAPLPGPLVEALVAAHVSPDAASLLAGAGIATIATPGPAGRQAVAWGSRADLVIDEATGATLLDRPLPTMHNAYGLALGWYERLVHQDPRDDAQARRWLLSAAASTGLAQGAFAMTLRHAQDRVVFGSPLATRQAVQLRLAECKMLLHGCELSVQDAAWHATERPELATQTAALSWMFVADAVAAVLSHAHQLYGALGFCTETGLFRYSAMTRWLSLASPVRSAGELVMSRRASQEATPVSLVLDGFAPVQ